MEILLWPYRAFNRYIGNTVAHIGLSLRTRIFFFVTPGGGLLLAAFHTILFFGAIVIGLNLSIELMLFVRIMIVVFVWLVVGLAWRGCLKENPKGVALGLIDVLMAVGLGMIVGVVFSLIGHVSQSPIVVPVVPTPIVF